MADTKISALTAAGSALTTHEYAVNEAGTSKKVTGTQLVALANTSPQFTGGAAGAGTWPTLASGTLLTAAVAGAIERDATNWYLTTDANNRGIVPVEHFIRANTTRTFTSNTAQQAIFTSPTNGTLTLEVGVYEFSCFVGMDTMSATSGNGKFSLLGAGTATLTQILMEVGGIDITLDATSNRGGSMTVSATQGATNAAPANAATDFLLVCQGTFNVSVAGTIIPSFAQTTAAAAVVKIGSYFKCKRLGAQAVISVGQWT